MMHRITFSILLLGGGGCAGTAGGELLEFDAFAVGPSDAEAGGTYSLTTGRGYEVTLTRAKLHVGAVYLNKTVPTSVASNTSCFLPGIYVAEVTTGLDVDVLSPDFQPFPEKGFATSEAAKAAEVWLTGGDVNDESDGAVILDIAGTATKSGESFPFEGTVTIGENRVVTPTDPSLPGAKPICKQRIVTPIPIDIVPREGGDLVMRVDPRGWFANVDFAKLEKVADEPPLYRFHDASDDQPSTSLYDGLRASIGPYAFSWIEGGP